MAANIDFETLRKVYFQWDTPVEYNVDDFTKISIYPVQLKDSELFIAASDIFLIDKDKIPDVNIISMSYLDFLVDYVIEDPIYSDKFIVMMKLCLHWDAFNICTKIDGKHWIESEDGKIKITSKEFNNIRRIILYQNIIGYDDSYINPELKAAMEETDSLRNRGIEFPNIERRMAIVTSHCGLPKSNQMEMTYRSHTLLFREVSGEVDFSASWAIILYAGETNKHEHWIYKKQKSKFDGYIIEQRKFTSNLGANPNDIKQTVSDNTLDDMFNNFNK